MSNKKAIFGIIISGLLIVALLIPVSIIKEVQIYESAQCSSIKSANTYYLDLILPVPDNIKFHTSNVFKTENYSKYKKREWEGPIFVSIFNPDINSKMLRLAVIILAVMLILYILLYDKVKEKLSSINIIAAISRHKHTIKLIKISVFMSFITLSVYFMMNLRDQLERRSFEGYYSNLLKKISNESNDKLLIKFIKPLRYYNAKYSRDLDINGVLNASDKKSSLYRERIKHILLNLENSNFIKNNSYLHSHIKSFNKSIYLKKEQHDNNLNYLKKIHDNKLNSNKSD